MSEMKSFSRINGWMLVSVFSLSALAAFAPDLFDRWMASIPEQKAFARLVRAEDKSYFSYHRYYFTLLYRAGNEDVHFVTAVDSDVFHRRKIGDNIEVLVRSSHSLRIAGNESDDRNRAALILSLIFAAAGASLLLLAIRSRTET